MIRPTEKQRAANEAKEEERQKRRLQKEEERRQKRAAAGKPEKTDSDDSEDSDDSDDDDDADHNATLPSHPGSTVDSGMKTTLVAPGEVRGGCRSRRSLQRAASSCSLPLSDHVRLSPSLPAVPPP